MKAVIDLGSNSALLLVADEEQKPVLEESIITGLGRGVKATGLLSEEAMSDGLTAIQELTRQARSAGADQVEVVATMAMRIAKNRDEMLDRAAAQNTPITVISGEEEARLGLKAAATDPLFASEETVTVIDPGGHSTEIATAVKNGDSWETAQSRSCTIGALSLLDGPYKNERPDFSDRLAAVKLIDQAIGLEYLPHSCGRVVVLGASGTNLASIKLGLADWQPDQVHGHLLDYEEISRTAGWLADLSIAERSQIVGIEPGREKTLHASLLILERFLFATHALCCTVSIRGWRHAYLAEN